VKVRFVFLAFGCGALLLSGCSSNTGANTGPGAQTSSETSAQTSSESTTKPCDGTPKVGDKAPPGLKPGDLVSAHDLTEDFGSAEGFPTNARIFRILYVSTSHDEKDLVLVCGLAAAPAVGPKIWQISGKPTMRMVTRNHGTIGLRQRCLPSSNPSLYFWGPQPSGMGAVSYGTGLFNAKGAPENGALQYMLDQGWVISASDYLPDDTYIIGRVAAANVIDAARATAQLMAEKFPSKIFEQTDVILSGHSQGGHATLWAGQLFETYLAATNDKSVKEPPMNLRGVLAMAPASNFILQPDKQPEIALGNGLADWEMHQLISPIGVPIKPLELDIGPTLASYIFGSWSQFSKNSPVSTSGVKTPAAPPGTSPLNLDAIATEEGERTIERIVDLCLGGQDVKEIKKLAEPYQDAATNQLLIAPLWNLPANYKKGEYFKAGFDKTCATTKDGSIQDWCTWLRWNLPGPNAENPYPKVPAVDGKPVPTLIGQGMDDTVIHCVHHDSADKASIPDAPDCMSVALYESLASQYCGLNPDSYLMLDLYRHITVKSPASHLSLPGQMAARGPKWTQNDLVFDGSVWQKFVTNAFEGTLTPGCDVQVINK